VVCAGGGQAYSRYFDGRGRRILDGNYAPTFTVELMQKDVALAAQMAGPSLAHMPMLRETLAAYTEALRAGWAGEDFSGVTHVVEQRFGLKISS
jgi:3-hydroxyisobutyrate dehydrogenase-like beta-hydroxyacid dehydrogenase